MKLFIDTGAFIALTDVSDENHSRAETFYRNVVVNDVKFVTTNFVVCETMNYLNARISHHVSAVFRENLKNSSIVEIVNITPLIEDMAFNIFKQYNDKDFSFTDCTSFYVMRSLKLSKAFAFDRHFEQFEKFSLLP